MIYKSSLALAFTLLIGASASGAYGQETVSLDYQLDSVGEHPTFSNDNLDESVGEVIGIQRLAVGNMVFVEGDRGNFLISEDGRYIFQGVLHDRWMGQAITDLEGAIRAVRVPLSQYPVDLKNEIASIQLGNAPKRQGAIFIDPTTEHSQNLVRRIIESPDDYNVDAVLMPAVNGDAAAARSISIYCAVDQHQAILDLAYGTSKSFDKQRPNCPRERVAMSLVLNQVFKIDGLPHIIREDGRSVKGIPVNLKEWLGIQL